MKLIIEARLMDDLSESPPVHLATIDRELTTDKLGLSLSEGKTLLELPSGISFRLSAWASPTLTRTARSARQG